MLKSALHVHSKYSDGEFSLPELRDKFLAAGCEVVFMADHADAFHVGRLLEYVHECQQHSDERFLFVPGLEFGCARRMHVVGFGVTELLDSDDPELVISHIREHQGVAVIAHPPEALFEWIESFEVLPDGIEGWNSKYDGRYAPRPSTFDLIERLKRRRPALKAFYGQDLHWRRQYAGLFTRIDVALADPTLLLAALVDGHFEGVKDSLLLPSSGSISSSLRSDFARISRRSRRFRGAVKGMRGLMGGLVNAIPSSIKAQLRRFF